MGCHVPPDPAPKPAAQLPPTAPVLAHCPHPAAHPAAGPSVVPWLAAAAEVRCERGVMSSAPWPVPRRPRPQPGGHAAAHADGRMGVAGRRGRQGSRGGGLGARVRRRVTRGCSRLHVGQG
ncbi:hypothetical protein HaLaN_26215 [Haematococcus lacustris]|uniref:Uncharacterized protein n=1 Tax=Haematococcus lacustris TaxID=44745 RepID=A0A6A0A5P1_HAELA|nr:hypothetical protein HaLaN_26215 [Haematococcus lacustris]